jgi:hypothetical protein
VAGMYYIEEGTAGALVLLQAFEKSYGTIKFKI